jgi:hypothetical protein
MTTQTVLLQTQDYGASLTSATLRNITTDTLEKTADSANEVTADGGLYALVFGEATVIPAGWYRVRAIIAGLPILRYVYLTGVDTETAYAVVDMPVIIPPTALEIANKVIEQISTMGEVI